MRIFYCNFICKKKEKEIFLVLLNTNKKKESVGGVNKFD